MKPTARLPTELDRLRYLWQVYGLGRGTLTKSWRSPLKLAMEGLDKPAGEAVYPLVFAPDDHENLLTDERGIPLIDYANLGTHPNPWFTGHIALARHARLKASGDRRLLEGFRTLADWFVDEAVPLRCGVGWPCRFAWFGGHRPPWYSAISQSHGISTLLRAARLFGSSTYADVAREGCRMLVSPLEEEGTAVSWPDGTLSLEESPVLPPSTVLNGHLFGVYAAWEAGRTFDDARFLDAAERGWSFVSKRLARFDLGYWSAYSLRRLRGGVADIASTHYHAIHVGQLRIAAAATGDTVLERASERFEQYRRSALCRTRAIWKKRFVKLLG